MERTPTPRLLKSWNKAGDKSTKKKTIVNKFTSWALISRDRLHTEIVNSTSWATIDRLARTLLAALVVHNLDPLDQGLIGFLIQTRGGETYLPTVVTLITVVELLTDSYDLLVPVVSPTTIAKTCR